MNRLIDVNLSEFSEFLEPIKICDGKNAPDNFEEFENYFDFWNYEAQAIISNNNKNYVNELLTYNEQELITVYLDNSNKLNRGTIIYINSLEKYYIIEGIITHGNRSILQYTAGEYKQYQANFEHGKRADSGYKFN